MRTKNMLNQRLRVVIYLEGDQTGEGKTLQEQEAACRAVAQEKGYLVVSILKDVGWSGEESLAGRPALAQALGFCIGGQADILLLSTPICI